MPFKKGGLNNPSFRQKRKNCCSVADAVLERIAGGMESSSVLSEAGVRDKDATKRWKNIIEETENTTPLKRSGNRPRKVKKTLT